MKSTTLLACALLAATASSATAQYPADQGYPTPAPAQYALAPAPLPPPGAAESSEALRTRVDQLEAETQALRGQLQSLRELPPPPGPAAVAPAPASGLAWQKGDCKIVPYGTVWFAMSYDTQRAVPEPYIWYVRTPSLEDDSDFSATARSTRLGFDVTGPRVPFFDCAQSGARVELDFQGTNVLENRGTVLMRHAYVEMKTDEWRLLGGQTSDVISPLLPGTLNYSVGWAGGNIGYRRPQLRYERYIESNERVLWTVQSSVNAVIPTDPGMDVENAGWPVIEGRAALSLGDHAKGSDPVVVGLSGHIGQESTDFIDQQDFLVHTWSVNGDLRVPITKYFGLQGEVFRGEVLGTFFGGIFQCINPVDRNGIRSTGGWAEVWYDLASDLHLHAGWGLDDPNNADLTFGQRAYNQFYFGNVVWDVTKQVVTGIEFSWWNTHYVGQLPGEDFRTEYVLKYVF